MIPAFSCIPHTLVRDAGLVAEARGGERGHEVEQGVGEGEIDKHPDPAEDRADYDQQDGGLRADDVRGDDAVDHRRTDRNPVERRQHEQEQHDADGDEEAVHEWVVRHQSEAPPSSSGSNT